jgi:hypothetical protein
MQQQHRCTCADSFHQRLAGSEESLRSRLNQTMLQISDMIHVTQYPGKEVPTDERDVLNRTYGTHRRQSRASARTGEAAHRRPNTA